MSDEAKPAQDAKGRFVSGNIGGGRPKGARAKLGEAFLEAMLSDFKEHGVLAVQTVRAEKPDQYLKVIAAILPKEITGEDGDVIKFSHRIELVGVMPDGDR